MHQQLLSAVQLFGLPQIGHLEVIDSSNVITSFSQWKLGVRYYLKGSLGCDSLPVADPLAIRNLGWR
jgi:hypothetical protein